ncbi:MAG: ABC transporter ATP-binding protein [Gammaproteobacteria bacterium]
MTDDVLLAAHGLVRNFGRHQALCGIDLTLRRGEVLGFLGLNGAGKSTALQILAGALARHGGEITICGHDLERAPRAARAALGFLPQVPPLYDDMLVDEYLALCGRLHGLAGGALATALARARQRAGLGDCGNRLIRHLSQGFRQRTGIAQAILHDPPVVLLDEPTAALDPAQIRDVRELIRDLGRQHAVLVSTHILPEVRLLANRVMILHQGHIVHDAPVGAALGPVRIRFAHEPARAALIAIAGVHQAQRLDDGAWLLDIDQRLTSAETIASSAVAAGWGVRELIADYDALEYLFMRLTAGGSA